MIQLEGYHLMAQGMSKSGETVAFGDNQGLIHIWSVNDTPRVNMYSSPVVGLYNTSRIQLTHKLETAWSHPLNLEYDLPVSNFALSNEWVNLYRYVEDVPPHRPPCVERSFVAAPGADEHDPVGPAPFQLTADPSMPPLSYEDPSATVTVGQCPHVIPKEVLKATRQVDFMGYAANPYYKRGGERGLAYRAAAPLQNKRAESRAAVEDAKKAAAAASKHPGGISVTPLPKLYHRVEVRLSASRARFEEFDFSFYNRTRLPGLVNDLAELYALNSADPWHLQGAPPGLVTQPLNLTRDVLVSNFAFKCNVYRYNLANCYVNPVLQMLHFVPELRARRGLANCDTLTLDT
jgi:hypothetical protein